MPRAISVVLFDVRFVEHDAGTTEAEAVRQAFAFTPALQFRQESSTQYQAGNMVTHSGGVITAEIRTQRKTVEIKTRLDKSAGYKVEERRADIVVSDAAAVVAYHPSSHMMALAEKAHFPFSRLVSYIRHASNFEGRRWQLAILPRKDERPLEEWLEHFDEIRSVHFEFTHSQSPGDDLVDKWIETLNADRIAQTVRAAPETSLSGKALASKENPVGRVVNHLSVNPENGSATIVGSVDDEELKVDTRNPVERRREELEDVGPDAVSVALARLLRGLAR